MAKEKKEKKKKGKEEKKSKEGKESKSSEGGKGGMIGLAIKAVIVLAVSGGAGFGVGTFLNAPADEQSVESQEGQENPGESSSGDDATSGDPAYEYVDFEEVTSNLDDPRMTKHIMAKIKLAISNDDNPKEVAKLINQEKARLKNWLSTYFGGCTLNDVRGAKNRNRIRREIGDRFNELLWPGKKPLIKEVLFEKFVVTV